MRVRRNARVSIALVAVLAMALAACGGGNANDNSTTTTTGGSSSGAALSQYDLSGIKIAVGSKDFDEQLLLGNILVEAYTAAGATVDNKVDLGGTNVARAALLSGQIDVYPEYNGTGWTVHLGRENPSNDPAQLTKNVKEADLKENNIVWLGRTPFNDTYGFATGPDLTSQHGGAFTMKEMASYLKDNPKASVCMESEFPSRDDGLILFENYTGYTIPESQQKILDTGVIYTETAKGNCDFGEIFTTDGRINALDLSVVKDPGVMILYNVSITMRKDLYDQAPDKFSAIADLLLNPLTNDKMAELNARVSAQGEDPATVAHDYLVSEGLISG